MLITNSLTLKTTIVYYIVVSFRFWSKHMGRILTLFSTGTPHTYYAHAYKNRWLYTMYICLHDIRWYAMTSEHLAIWHRNNFRTHLSNALTCVQPSTEQFCYFKFKFRIFLLNSYLSLKERLLGKDTSLSTHLNTIEFSYYVIYKIWISRLDCDQEIFKKVAQDQ